MRSEDLFEKFGPPKVWPGVPQLAADLTDAAFAKTAKVNNKRLSKKQAALILLVAAGCMTSKSDTLDDMRLRFYFHLLHKGFTPTTLRTALRKLFEGTVAPAMTATEYLGPFKPPTTTVPAPAFDKVPLTIGNSSAAAQFNSLQVEQVDFTKDQIRGFTMDRIDSISASIASSASQLLPLRVFTASGSAGVICAVDRQADSRGQGSVPCEVHRQARGTDSHA
jgi:hypothetical protein